MDKLKLQLCELLWKNKCCIIYKNKNTRDYELRILTEKILQYPYLLRCFIYLLKQLLRQFEFNCILSTNKRTHTFASILGYEIGVPVYDSKYDIKDLQPIYLQFFITLKKSTEQIQYQKIGFIDTQPMKKNNINITPSLLHIYELLDYGYNHKLINNDDWELCHMYYYDKIPFEYRNLFTKDINNRNLAITQCYNILFRKKTNLILDCSGYNAIDSLKLISTYGDYFFIVIVDTDCFTTVTKKHRECFLNSCKEKTLLIYDRLRIEKLGKEQVKQIIERKMGKENWLQGFFLYSYSREIVSFFKDNYPNLRLFFVTSEFETSHMKNT